MGCEHRNIRRVYSHGKKSKPMLVCKDCGKILKRYELKKQSTKNKQMKKRNWKEKEIKSCFGTKEFGVKSSICKKCNSYKKCKDVKKRKPKIR